MDERNFEGEKCEYLIWEVSVISIDMEIHNYGLLHKQINYR